MITKISTIFSKLTFILFLLVLVSCDNKKEVASQEEGKLKQENVAKEKEDSTKDSTVIKKEKIYSTEIKSLDDFQNSHFFEKYNCYKADSWLLNTGLTNYAFDTNLKPTASIDFSVLDNEFKHLGLIFYYRSELNENDYTFINDLLSEFNLGSQKEKVYSFIKKNIETPAEQIKKSKSLVAGKLKFRAGKVIQQTITIDKN